MTKVNFLGDECLQLVLLQLLGKFNYGFLNNFIMVLGYIKRIETLYNIYN